jgi:hypothetical protein
MESACRKALLRHLADRTPSHADSSTCGSTAMSRNDHAGEMARHLVLCVGLLHRSLSLELAAGGLTMSDTAALAASNEAAPVRPPILRAANGSALNRWAPSFRTQ